MSNEDRRRHMVDAALDVMLRKGIAATTARDVAAAMDSSPGLIHHYFESMDELVVAAFEQAAARGIEATRTAVAAVSEPAPRVSEFFRSYSRVDRDWAFQLWLDAWADASRRPALRAASRRLNEEWQQLLASIIEDGVRAGSFSCPDVPGAAWRVLSILDGLTLQAVAHGEPFDRGRVLPWSAGVAERELGLEPGTLGF